MNIKFSVLVMAHERKIFLKDIGSAEINII